MAWVSGSNRSNNYLVYASSSRPTFNIAACNIELEPFMSDVSVVFYRCESL